jgi:hypothetical protein
MSPIKCPRSISTATGDNEHGMALVLAGISMIWMNGCGRIWSDRYSPPIPNRSSRLRLPLVIPQGSHTD